MFQYGGYSKTLHIIYKGCKGDLNLVFLVKFCQYVMIKQIEKFEFWTHTANITMENNCSFLLFLKFLKKKKNLFLKFLKHYT